MAKNRIPGIFWRIVKIKPSELKISFLLFFYLFLVIAAYNVIKPIRNASLLDELGYKWLPLSYLVTAIVIGFVVAIHAKIQVHISRFALITSSLLFFFLSCFAFRLLSNNAWQGLPIIFWVWANVFIIVLNTQFWITVNDVLNPREFKKMSGFFISGGIMGGFVGGSLAGVLAQKNVDYDLLYLSAGLLALCSLFVHLIFRWQKKERPDLNEADKKGLEKVGTTFKPGFRDNFNTVKKHKYLRLIAAIVVLTLVVSTLIDFQFQTVVQNTKGGNLTSFFGYFNAGLMIFAFLISILMTSKLFKRYGVRLSLLLYPLVLLLCISGIGVFISLFMAIMIKGSDKSLSYTINRAARELLFIPVSSTLKYKAIVFIDMFVDRFAKGIGAVLLLAILLSGIQDYKEIVRIVSLVSVALIFSWIVLTLRASREYVNSVKQKLSRKWDRADQLVEDKLDVDVAKLIFDTLKSKFQSPDLYAMHVFELMKRGKLSPELKQLLSSKTGEITSSSLNPYFQTAPLAMMSVDDLAYNEDQLEKEIQEIMSLEAYENVISGYIDKVLSDASNSTEKERMEIAKALGFLDTHSPLAEKLKKLLRDESREVRKFAIESAAKLKKREYVPALIHNLGESSIQSDASAALEKYGEKITGILADYLGDSDEKLELRKAIAPILAHVGNQEAADFLVKELAQNAGELDRELIDSLDRIRSEYPELGFSESIIKKKTREKVRSYCDLFVELVEVESRGNEAVTCAKMSQKLNLLMMDIFKLLGLLYPYEDMAKAYQNIQTGTKNSVAYAVELLDITLEKGIKEAILPLVEDLSQEERLKACLVLKKNPPNF